MNDRDTYYPKALARFTPKCRDFMNLKTLSQDAVLKTLLVSKICSGEGRDARAKKNFRKYLDDNLPREVQRGIVDRCINRWFGVERVLKILDIFEPKSIMTPNLDLLGSFRYAYGCYFVGDKLFWSNGTIERLNLNSAQCNRLYQYILFWSRTPNCQLRLQNLAISTDRGALGTSALPSLIARSHTLTRVTILNGATNHILRLLGINCPSLAFLDISHSQAVNDTGIRGLILKNPRRRQENNNPQELVNGCARSLMRIVTIGTSITEQGTDHICTLMNSGYSVSFLPDSMIYRPDDGNPVSHSIALNRSEESPLENINLNMSKDLVLEIQKTVTRFIEQKHGAHQQMDFFGDVTKGQLYIRPMESFLAQGVIGIHNERITELLLTWDSFTWGVTTLPDLTELGVSLPSLRVLKARLQGSWERNEPLLPFLVEVYIWTVSDATVVSFLKWSPSIQSFKCNCLNLVPDNVALNDDSLKSSLRQNPRLMASLKEISIRPAVHLTPESVRFILKYCRNLERLGDMESWNVSTNNIKKFNRILDTMNSNCILTVLSFPPRKIPEYLL